MSVDGNGGGRVRGINARFRVYQYTENQVYRVSPPQFTDERSGGLIGSHISMELGRRQVSARPPVNTYTSESACSQKRVG